LVLRRHYKARGCFLVELLFERLQEMSAKKVIMIKKIYS